MAKESLPFSKSTRNGLTAEDRFWQKVNKTDSCWLWTGSKSPQGYGLFYAQGRNARAHRHTPNFGCALILSDPPCRCWAYRPPTTEPSENPVEPAEREGSENKSAHIESTSVSTGMDKRTQIATLLTSAATALDSQWCEKDKNALLELAQSFRERGEPLTKAEQKYLKRIFLPTEEEKQIEAELDAVVDLLESVRTRFLYCELPRDCGPLEILKTLIKDRENVYESLRVSMTD